MIDIQQHDDFTVLTLNRPDSMNALSREMLRQLDAALGEVERSDARCVILTGNGGKAFCAGADIAELTGRSLEQELDGTLSGQRVFSRLEALRIPSIALVNGYALGGGCELSLACTFRLATPGARFGLPEIKLGLVPGYGGTQRLPRLIGMARALEIMMSARLVCAEEALQLGLVNRIVPADAALAGAMEFGKTFTRWSSIGLRLIRDAVLRGSEVPLAEGLQIEARASTLSYRTDDGREGLEAFIDKRRPRFVDR